MNKYKTYFSLLTILVVVLIFILLPKTSKPKNMAFQEPNYSVRRIPAPTPTLNANDNLLTISSQPPSNKIVISKVDFQSGGYIKIFNKEEEIGRSEVYTGMQENLEITLLKETTEPDAINIVLYDEQNTEIVSKEVGIITTAIMPGVILPKDLQ